MPQFNYRGRDKEGHLRVGQRFALTIDHLNADLIKEGIYPIKIILTEIKPSTIEKLREKFQGNTLHISELAIFSRQMQLLHEAGVPMVTALKQLASHTRSTRLAHALNGIIENLEKGQSLAIAMQNYPSIFSPLMVNVIQIGENTGRLSQAFEHIHEYLEFEATTIKQIKASFRYPIFVLIAITLAIIILNIFVIPTFSKFYANIEIALPWQTRVLIGMSNFFIHYGIYLLITLIGIILIFSQYLKTKQGKYQWHKLELHLPLLGKLLRRIILIRFCQSLSTMLSAGISITQGLTLVKNVILNSYTAEQISQVQEAIERGVAFTQAITKVDLFTPLEVQILAVGEKNGELSPALNYIGNFHSHEIEFDLKRMNDWVGPLLIGAVAGLILILALGVYLPIWNMINSTHT